MDPPLPFPCGCFTEHQTNKNPSDKFWFLQSIVLWSCCLDWGNIVFRDVISFELWSLQIMPCSSWVWTLQQYNDFALLLSGFYMATTTKLCPIMDVFPKPCTIMAIISDPTDIMAATSQSSAIMDPVPVFRDQSQVQWFHVGWVQACIYSKE